MAFAPGWEDKIVSAQTRTHDPIGDQLLARIPYGEERQDWHADTIPCHDCGVVKGQLHVPSCDIEQCPNCGDQALSCDCDPGDAGSQIELQEAIAQDITCADEFISARLSDGQMVTRPLSDFPRLLHGTKSERANFRITRGGRGIHWPDLDEDISVVSLLRGQRSGETQESLRRWLKSRSPV